LRKVRIKDKSDDKEPSGSSSARVMCKYFFPLKHHSLTSCNIADQVLYSTKKEVLSKIAERVDPFNHVSFLTNSETEHRSKAKMLL